MELAQYEIVLINLDPTVRSEIKKTRPCVIISPNEMNRFLNTIIVAPMTSGSKSYPTRISVNHNDQKGWVVIDQIRTLDRQRIIKKVGQLEEKEIQKVKDVILETFVK